MARENPKAVKIYPHDEKLIRKVAAFRYSQDLDKKQLTPARLIHSTFRIPKVLDILKTAKIGEMLDE